MVIDAERDLPAPGFLAQGKLHFQFLYVAHPGQERKKNMGAFLFPERGLILPGQDKGLPAGGRDNAVADLPVDLQELVFRLLEIRRLEYGADPTIVLAG